MRHLGLALALSQAISEGEVIIAKESFREAYNLRQRFYRFREFLRDEDHTLSAVADQFKFEVQGNKLRIIFEQLDYLGESNDDVKNSSKRNSSWRT